MAYSGLYLGKVSSFGAATGPAAKETAIKGRVDCQIR